MVGVGVVVTRDEGRKVLLGKRKGSHGAGTWSFPGGHLEYGEQPWDTAQRELFEETGLLPDNGRVYTLRWYTNDVMEDDEKHYLTLYVRIYVKDDEEPVVREPEKCEEWCWFDWDHLPDNLFLPIRNLRAAGFNPFWSEG